jgi:hypothetical protein
MTLSESTARLYSNDSYSNCLLQAPTKKAQN